MSEALTDAQFERLFERAVIQNFEDMLDTIPSRAELEKMYTFSQRHNTRMEKLFRLVWQKDMLEKAVHWAQRIAVTAAIIIAIGFGILVTFSPEVRAAVSETIVQWFEGFTKFLSSESSGDTLESKTLRPQYLPKGFEESETFLDGDFNLIVYTNTGGEEIWFQVMSSDASLSINNDGVIGSMQIIDGIDYYLFESYDGRSDNSIVWYDSGYSFMLLSKSPIETLQAIALSVRP